MEHLDLINLLTPEMISLGYTKVDEYSFTLPQNGFIIMSDVVRREKPARFDIILAVAFTQTAGTDSWKNYRRGRGHANFETSLYELLLKLGEPAQYLDRLFQNKQYETTATEIIEHLPEIISLFKRKVLPFFEKWNDPTWLIKNFEDKIYGKIFYIIEPIEDCIKLFRQQMGMQIISNITTQ